MTVGTEGVAMSDAAAAHLQLIHEEEERLTNYTNNELADHWEFKILRASTNVIRKPEVLRQVCAEEAAAGWILVEKFDDMRLRFKRPLSARNLPPEGPGTIDPYRTTYGNGAQIALIIGASVALLLAAAVALVLLRKIH